MATPVLSRVERIPRISRFGWLMGLYAENFALLTRLFEPADLAPGSWLSCIGDGLDLRLDVLEQHRYTSELRLTYALRDPVTGEPDPSAFLRMYHDARQVEATHCYVGRRCCRIWCRRSGSMVSPNSFWRNGRSRAGKRSDSRSSSVSG